MHRALRYSMASEPAIDELAIEAPIDGFGFFFA